jgi:hypothetical protein
LSALGEAVSALLAQCEPLASLSTAHLSARSRKKLAEGALSIVVYYSNDYGGFVLVGHPGDALPDEPDLRLVVEVAREAKLSWLKFVSDAAVIGGLQVFDEEAAE